MRCGTRCELQRRLERGIVKQEVVTFSMTVQNVKHSALLPHGAFAAAFEMAVKHTLAAEIGPGLLPDHIAMTIKPDFVVRCTITPPNGMHASMISAILAKRIVVTDFLTLGQIISTRIAALDGIADASIGTVDVVGLKQHVTSVFYPVVKLGKNHRIPSRVFNLYESLGALDDTRTFDASEVSALDAQEVDWSLHKCAEVFKNRRLERLYVGMVGSLQRKDGRSCNLWAASLTPNMLQFILSENPVKREICSSVSGFPRQQILDYVTSCKLCVAMAIVAGAVLEHWAYDLTPEDQAFLRDAGEKLATGPNFSVVTARGLWDRSTCRYVVVDQAARKRGGADVALSYLRWCPQDILCSHFRAPWRGPAQEVTYFHLYPAFSQQGGAAAEELIEVMARAFMDSSSDLTSIIKALLEDPEVPYSCKRDVIVLFVSAFRRLEDTPPVEPPKGCLCFRSRPKEQDYNVLYAENRTKDLELVALDAIMNEYTTRGGDTISADAGDVLDIDLAEMLEAVLLTSLGDSLWTWSKNLLLEEPQMANDAKMFLTTIGAKHVSGLMRAATMTDRAFQYDDVQAQELIDGAKRWMLDRGAGCAGEHSRELPRQADDLGQMLRMYLKLGLALEGGNIWVFMQALEEGSECMASCFEKIAPRGSSLRLTICQDVQRSLSESSLQDYEIDPLLSYSGFFSPYIQLFLRSNGAVANARNCFGNAGVVIFIEAMTKLISLEKTAPDRPTDEISADICKQCSISTLHLKLFVKVIKAVRSQEYKHDAGMFDISKFRDCAYELGKASRLLQYKQAHGFGETLLNTVDGVIDSILSNTLPRSWVSSFHSLDTVIFVLEYMGKEDLQLAFERFEAECKDEEQAQLLELLGCVKSIYSQSLVSMCPSTITPDMDLKDVISNRASALQQKIVWHNIAFEPADWQKILEIAGAAADAMKQKYSVMMLPHHTQMITLLMFAIRACGAGSGNGHKEFKTMLARVGTGEGKSLIIGMLAAFIAKKGMRAHVINKSRVLTQRDFMASDVFFRTLGIRASMDDKDLKNNVCKIVYCTSDDVEEWCLTSLTNGEVEEYEQGLKNAVLIVDEVDGLIFDGGTTTKIFYEDPECSLWVNDWLAQLRTQGQITRDWDDFRSLNEYSRSLQKEVEEAYYEALSKEDGRHFTKRGDTIYMIDPKTNLIMEQGWSLWLEILRSLQSQHNFPAKFVKYKHEKAVLSKLQCFMSYSCIFGLTGSLGRPAEKKYLLDHYEAITFNVPFFLDTCRADAGQIQGKKVPRYINESDPCRNQEEQDRAVVSLAASKSSEVPVLVIAKDPKAVDRLAEQLQEQLFELYGARAYDDDCDGSGGNQRILKLLHNPQNPQEFVELVDRATEPLEPLGGHDGGGGGRYAPQQSWSITLTTAEGGRGHDYRVMDPSIDEKGGLLLILTWVPLNERDWIQLLGRTGRQDHAGQYAVFLNAQDEHVQAARSIWQSPAETFIDAMLRYGDQEIEQMLSSTTAENIKGKLMHKLTSKYWCLNKQEETTVRQNWRWKELCKEYLSMTTDNIQGEFKNIFPNAAAFGIKPAVLKTTSSIQSKTCKWTNTSRYKGSLVNDKPHGYGLFAMGDGTTYEGQWCNGQRHGYGRYVDASGAVYEGGWKENDQSGWGVEFHKDEGCYEGEFFKGCKHGIGKYTTSTGATYKGQFVHDKMDGDGCYESTAGRKYFGQWRQGQLQGATDVRWIPTSTTGGLDAKRLAGSGKKLPITN